MQAASNGTKVVTLMATDQDDDVNGDITFTIIDGGYFLKLIIIMLMLVIR